MVTGVKKIDHVAIAVRSIDESRKALAIDINKTDSAPNN
jgi:hypothetical protein